MQFAEHTFNFPPDYDGAVVSTLVSHRIASNRAVLYIHGYTDYFFQEHVAEWFVSRGYSFYAVDLRKYGRSLRDGQHPNFCRSLTEYYPDITASLEYISAEGATEIVLMGHSTGGLIASLYAAEAPARKLITKLILNSPFFEFNTTAIKRYFVIPAATILSMFLPFMHSKPELSPYYAQSVHADHHGHWLFNTEWKPIDGFPLYFSWLAAVRCGQRKLHQGLKIDIPILVVCSASSHCSAQWSEAYMVSDGVLNVDHIAEYAMKLGDNIILKKFDGGMHDLLLSSEAVRGEVFRIIDNFIK